MSKRKAERRLKRRFWKKRNKDRRKGQMRFERSVLEKLEQSKLKEDI